MLFRPRDITQEALRMISQWSNSQKNAPSISTNFTHEQRQADIAQLLIAAQLNSGAFIPNDRIFNKIAQLPAPQQKKLLEKIRSDLVKLLKSTTKLFTIEVADALSCPDLLTETIYEVNEAVKEDARANKLIFLLIKGIPTHISKHPSIDEFKLFRNLTNVQKNAAELVLPNRLADDANKLSSPKEQDMFLSHLCEMVADKSFEIRPKWLDHNHWFNKKLDNISETEKPIPKFNVKLDNGITQTYQEYCDDNIITCGLHIEDDLNCQ